jgi:hypothetical protein
MASPKQAIEEAWNRANTLASETEGWKEEKKDDVALLTSKNFEGCPVNCFKVVGTLSIHGSNPSGRPPHLCF